MAGMLFTGNAVFTSIAVGAMLMVAVALIGSLSILPALLAKLGHRVDKGRIPLLGRRSGGESRRLGLRARPRPAPAAACRRCSPAARCSRSRCRRSRCTRSCRASPTCRSRCRSSARTSRSSTRSRVRRRRRRSWSRRDDVTAPARAAGDRRSEAAARSRAGRCSSRSRPRSTRRAPSRPSRSRSQGDGSERQLGRGARRRCATA